MHDPAEPAPFPTDEMPQHVLQDQDAFEDDPQFHHLTLTNAAPAEAEVGAIRSMVAALEKQKATVEIESARLRAPQDPDGARIEQELALMDISQERISGAIFSPKCVLPPVQRLPTEILQSIFLLTLDPDLVPQVSFDEEDERWEFTAPEEYTLPSLELVCRQWRETALGFPQLWSTICTRLPVLNNTDADNSSIISGISLYLHRSKSCPLSLVLYHTWDGDAAPDLIAILLPHASRIVSLHLYLEYSQMHSLSSLASSLHSLTTLAIFNATFKLEDDSPRQEFDEPQRLFGACEILQHVFLINVRYPSACVAFPKTTVTSVAAIHPPSGERGFDTGTTASEIHLMLRDYPNLRHLEFTMDYGYNREWEMVVAHNLVSLDIIHYTCADTLVGYMLNKITAPSLTDFCLVADPPTGVESFDLFDSILNMVERSKCALQRFEYRSAYITAMHIKRFLEYTNSTLEYLVLNDVASREVDISDMTTALVEALTPRDQEMLAPRLRHLSVFGLAPNHSDSTGDKSYVDPFAAMVCARREAGSPLNWRY